MMPSVSVLIDTLLNMGARVLAPVMPWLHLALRRAAIPTLCAGIVGILFFVIPQSREILHSFTASAPTEVGSATQEHGTIPLASYIVTATLLSIAVWYTARLLCTVEIASSVPYVLTIPPGNGFLSNAISWYPRILGTMVLASAMAALLYATFTPRLEPLRAGALAAGLIGAPLCVVILRRRRILIWLGVIGTIGAIAAAFLLGVFSSGGFWIILVSALPACQLYFLIVRRDVLSNLGHPLGHASAPRNIGSLLWRLCALMAVSLIALNLLTRINLAAVRSYGSASTVLLFLLGAILGLTIIQLVIRKLAGQVTGLTGAVALVLAGLVAVAGSESLGEEHLEVQASGAPPVSVLPSNDTRDLYINAYGGGLRAAIYTAEVLALADDLSCGRAGERIRAFSAVSGGSLGVATYLLARQQLHATIWKDCQPGKTNQGTPLTDVVRSALVRDHLSPAVARMLAHDLPVFWRPPIRGQALMLSWHEALVDAISTKEHGKASGLGLQLAQLDGGMAHRPAVYFNSTNADTGETIAFSNIACAGADCEGSHQAKNMTVGIAVLHSARFPLVTPAGKIPGAVPLRLVDGGYADNSGTHTLARTFRTGLAGKFLLDIDGNLAEQSGQCRAPKKRYSPIPTAIVGLLESRVARASDAVKDFVSQSGIQIIELTYDLTADGDCAAARHAEQAPLGWFVGAGAASRMQQSAQRSAAEICKAAGLICGKTTLAGQASIVTLRPASPRVPTGIDSRLPVPNLYPPALSNGHLGG